MYAQMHQIDANYICILGVAATSLIRTLKNSVILNFEI